MCTSLLQIISLTCYGNAVLKGIAIPRFYPDHIMCGGCRSITFKDVALSHGPGGNAVLVADTPDNWFRQLLGHKALGIRLLHNASKITSQFPDRVTVGLVGGGGKWFMEVTFADAPSEIWTGRWDFEDDKWAVTYGMVARIGSQALPQLDIRKAKDDLEAALLDIRRFASEYEQSRPFAASFDEALATLANHGPNPNYYDFLVPPGCMPAAGRSLLLGAVCSDVFGAMGSWTDMVFSGVDKLEYDRVSEALWANMNEAISVATSSSSPLSSC
jgi:hypothetical protein